MKRLVVASTNPGKIRELQLALHDLLNWNVEPLPPGTAGIEETGHNFLENAALKSVHYSRSVEGFVLADDSGLCVKALGDRPGLYSARFAPTADARNRRVLTELAAIENADRGATFHCALAVAQDGAIVWSAEEQVHGKITSEPAGGWGFGYDPIFFVPEAGKTLAELSTEEKNRISARGRAITHLRRFLES